MALEKVTTSVNLASSINTKTDDKLVNGDQLTRLENAQMVKIGKLQKRNGLGALNKTVVSTLPNTVAIGASSLKSQLGFHFDQLLMQNNGVLYSRDSSNSKWNAKANFVPWNVQGQKLIAKNNSVIAVSSATLSGRTCMAMLYEESVQGADASDTSVPTKPQLKRIARFSVKDDTTGEFIVSDVALDTAYDTGTSTWSDFNAPKVLAVGTNFFIIYSVKNEANASINGFKCKVITPSTGAIASTNTIAATAFASIDYCFDAIALDAASLLPNCACVAYQDSGATTVKFLDSAGAVKGSPGSFSIAMIVTDILQDSSLGINKLFFAGLDSFVVKQRGYSFTATTTTSLYTLQTLSSSLAGSLGHMITQVASQSVANQIDVYFSFISIEPYRTAADSRDSYVYSRSISNSGTVAGAAQSTVIAGACIFAKAIKDTDRVSNYLPLIYYSRLQSTFFIADVSKTVVDGKPQILARFEYGSAGNCPVTSFAGVLTTIFVPLDVAYVTGSKIYFRQIYQASVLDVRSFSDSLNDRVFAEKVAGGVKEYIIERQVPYHLSSNFFNRSALFCAGFMHQYDGQEMVENNWLLGPEHIDVICKNRNLVTSTIAPTLGAGYKVKVSVNNGASFTYSVQNTSQQFEFVVDTMGVTNAIVHVFGNGANLGGAYPADGKHHTTVIVDKTYHANEVAQAIVDAMNADAFYSGGSYTNGITNNHDGTLTIELVSAILDPTPTDSAVTPVTGVTSKTSTDGYLPQGDYIYAAVFKYTDYQGNVHRSFPAFSRTVSIGASTSSFPGVLVWAPQVSNRQIANAEIEVYRTDANGTIYRLVSVGPNQPNAPLNYRVPFVLNNARASMRDTFVDATAFDAQPTLYTTGGIQENAAISSAQFMAIWKNRVVVAGQEDAFLISYSKSLLNDAPIEFTETNNFRVDSDKFVPTGIAVLDDKLIISKETLLYYVSGDGANDLGQQSSLSNPILIASDVGCVNHNSFVVYPDGLLFKSRKGIYKLNRSLSLEYIGAPVEDFNSLTISSATLIKDKNEIRFTHSDSATCLVYNYLLQKWGTFTNYQSDDALLYNGVFTAVRNNGTVRSESANFYDIDDDASTIVRYSMLLKTGWLKIKNPQDYQRVYRAGILGEYKSAHTLSIVAAYDYDPDSSHQQTYTFDGTVVASGSNRDDKVYQPEICFARQKCQSMQLTISETDVAGTGEACTLTDLAFVVGMKKGLNKVKAGKRL